MGTNYYLKTPACPHCGHSGATLHIGKSSAGWNFSLRIYLKEIDEDRLKMFGVEQILELDDWRPLFDKFPIFDEYDDVVQPAEMISRITERSHPNGLLSHLTAGPEHMGPYSRVKDDIRSGQLRAGKGTYDLFGYSFS